MIELRWVDWGITQELEYRFVTPNVDASGALCPPGEMSEWKRVSGVDARVAYPQKHSGPQEAGQ
jgi:hypothetical protein